MMSERIFDKGLVSPNGVLLVQRSRPADQFENRELTLQRCPMAGFSGYCTDQCPHFYVQGNSVHLCHGTVLKFVHFEDNR